MGITIVLVAIVLFMVIKTMNDSKKRKQESSIDANIQTDEVITKDLSSKLNLFSFKGRLKRGTYFWIYACVGVFSNLLNLFLDTTMDELPSLLVWMSILYFFVAAWIVFASTIKRCHDKGQSGWYALIPFYYIVLFFLKGEEKDNEYGPNPYVDNQNEWM